MTEWQERLRASGHRLTPQRELVLAAVEHLGHATPDDVYAEVRQVLTELHGGRQCHSWMCLLPPVREQDQGSTHPSAGHCPEGVTLAQLGAAQAAASDQ